MCTDWTTYKLYLKLLYNNSFYPKFPPYILPLSYYPPYTPYTLHPLLIHYRPAHPIYLRWGGVL